MSKRKTIKITLDNEAIFRLEISGSDDVVDTLVDSLEYKWALNKAVKALVENKVQAKVQPQSN